jgi:hypothetical protein
MFMGDWAFMKTLAHLVIHAFIQLIPPAQTLQAARNARRTCVCISPAVLVNKHIEHSNRYRTYGIFTIRDSSMRSLDHECPSRWGWGSSLCQGLRLPWARSVRHSCGRDRRCGCRSSRKGFALLCIWLWSSISVSAHGLVVAGRVGGS